MLESELRKLRFYKMMQYINLMRTPEVREIYKEHMMRAWLKVKAMLEGAKK